MAVQKQIRKNRVNLRQVLTDNRKLIIKNTGGEWSLLFDYKIKFGACDYGEGDDDREYSFVIK